MFREMSQLTLKTNEGEKTFDVLFNFYSDEYNKNFMVICESENEPVNGQIQVTPISYVSDEEGYVKEVYQIDSQEEFEYVKVKFEEELTRYQAQHQQHDHEHHNHEHECTCGGHCGCHHD